GNEELARRRPGWLAQQFDAGLAILIVDGLDETTPDDRDDRVLPWLAKLLDRYPNCRTIVTSRPAGYPAGALAALGFAECDLLDFDESEIERYVTQWCTAVRTAQGEEADEAKTNGEADGVRLVEKTRTNAYVRDLARNPLMLSAICLVQFFRRGELPHDRAVLYQWCVEGLLHEWDMRKGIQDEFGLDEKLRVTREVAIAMQQDGLAEYPAERVQTIFSETLHDAERAEALLAHIQARAGLLNERRPGVFGFAHLTFQEYLAALAVEQGNRCGVTQEQLVEEHKDGRWQEVIPLYCGLASDTNASFMIERLEEQTPSDELAWAVANAILAAGSKLSPEERNHGIRFALGCPEEGLGLSLALLPDEIVAPIANMECFAGPEYRFGSKAYWWLRDHMEYVDTRRLRSAVRDMRELTPQSRDNAVWLAMNALSGPDLLGLAEDDGVLGLLGPVDGIFSAPTVAHIALQYVFFHGVPDSIVEADAEHFTTELLKRAVAIPARGAALAQTAKWLDRTWQIAQHIIWNVKAAHRIFVRLDEWFQSAERPTDPKESQLLDEALAVLESLRENLEGTKEE
ncbi:NACHT domain-containing protein, partial [bacterium]|nr:NACHT domain-containing protein [bacterium]